MPTREVPVNPVDLLVIAAHPDDAELSVGGTLLVAADLGYRTAVIDLTRGELSSRGDLETRAQETARASEILDLAHRENLDLADGRVRDDHVARERLADAVRRLRPTTVLAPWKEDLHPDHAGAGLLVERTWYLLGVGKFAVGEAPYRPPLLAYYMLHTPFVPSVVIDITDAFERKCDAVRAYGSQLHAEGSTQPRTRISEPHFLAGLEGRARDYGLMVGCEFGEPLRWEWPPRIADPVQLGLAPKRNS